MLVKLFIVTSKHRIYYMNKCVRSQCMDRKDCLLLVYHLALSAGPTENTQPNCTNCYDISRKCLKLILQSTYAKTDSAVVL